MILTALIFDAIIGNVQEKSIKEYKATNEEVIHFSYGIGCVYILCAILINGDLQSGFQESNLTFYGLLIVYSVAGYFGVKLVLCIVRESGALVAVTVTSCRKVVTVILSFLVYSKPFSLQYVWGGLLVLLSIYINVKSKQKKWVNYHYMSAQPNPFTSYATIQINI